MRVAVGARSDVGRVRQGNEDALLVDEPVFVVADGMGGHLAGDVASAIAVEVIAQRAGAPDDLDARSLERFIKEANRTIWQKAGEDTKLQGMGTTCTLLMIDGETGHLAHVGDSRAYLLRDGRLEQLTHDHTLVQRMVEEGRLQPEEAQHHPQRSIITRALGVEDDVEVDMRDIALQPGDRILLCSDGLSSMLEDNEIHGILTQDGDPQGAADHLVDAANDAGGEDNITVVVLDLDPGEAGGSSRVAAVTRAPAPPHASDTEVGPAAIAEDDASELEEADEDEGEGESPPSRRGRALLVGLVVFAVIVLATFGAARYALANSWFVGTNDEGVVTIYRGIPEQVLGLSLKEPQEESQVSVHELPGYLQVTVEGGIKADSLIAARRTVANLEDRSRESLDAGATPSGEGNE